MNAWRLIAFAIVAVAQLAVPTWMIVRQKLTLERGRIFKLQTAPVDPYDAVRGRYVALTFAAATTPFRAEVETGQRAWVALAEDANGFARAEKISARPIRGDNVFRANVLWSKETETRLEFRFDRYYMDENVAPKAEEAYRSASSRDQQNAHVTIRVRNGYAALEELFIGGRKIGEYLREDSPRPAMP